MNKPLERLAQPLTQLGELSQASLIRGAAESVCLLEKGSVDVFMVKQDGTGARSFLFTVVAGELLIFPAADRAKAVLAQPSPDAEYRIIAKAALLDHVAQTKATLASLLAPLIEHIAAAFAEKAPTDCLMLGSEQVCSQEQALTLGAERAGLWFTSSGQTRYFGQLPCEAGALMPLPLDTWVSLAPSSELSCFEPDVSMPPEVQFEGVAVLFSLLLQWVTVQKNHAAEQELQRLQMKSAQGSQVMADALAGFVTLFSSQSASDNRGSDRLLAACKVIGSRLGVKFKAAPAEGIRGKDAVREIAQASGVRTRIVALKGDWWRNDNGPLLVFAEQSKQAFALLPLRGGGYQLYEPSGDVILLRAEFAAQLAPFAYTFYAALPSKKLALSDILQFVFFAIRQDIAVVAAIACASALLGMAIPLASGHLFDSVFPAADYGQMIQLVVILFIASIVTLLFEATRSLAMLRIEGRASSDLQAAVWDRVLALPVPFFRDYSAGDLAMRINGINEIRQALSGTVIASLISSLFAILNVFLLFYYSAKLAMLAVLLVTFSIGFNLAVGYFGVRITRQTAAVSGKLSGMVLEYLSGISKLRITGAESRAFANWAANFAAQKQLALRAGRLSNLNSVFSAAFPVAANALIFACLAMALAEPAGVKFSSGDFIAFGATWAVFLGAALSLVKMGLDLLAITATYDRTRPILEACPEVDESKASPGLLQGAIELSHLRFAYAADAPLVLDDVSMTIQPGEFIALVGASGSGKSTLLRLMLGFETPTHGGVYYDQHHLADVDIGAVRRQLGVVLQSGRLMSGDIFSNIIGSSPLKLADAWDAARACGLDQDINAMPMGMHTIVSDGGGTLSGGQRQRLLIARAIVNKPRIVFFDEATSALDNQSQALVSASMDQLQATRVVIAHRLSTIINADRIYVMDKGKIVQSGTYQQLIGEEGLFAELAKRQMA
jgi:NHLM bacteriocin system ABC transporter ATP-binding protein